MKLLKSRLFWFIITIAGLSALFYVSGLQRYLSLANIQTHMHDFKDCVQDHYCISVLTYIAILIFIAAISLPIIIFYVLLGGFLFGTLPGTLYSVIGTTIGATLSFLVFRYVLADMLKKKYSDLFDQFRASMKDHGIFYILILHYLTIVPFFIINTFAALAPISLIQFILITILGCGPLFLVYSFAGRELGNIQATKDIFSPPVIIACALLICLAFLPIIIKKLRKKK